MKPWLFPAISRKGRNNRALRKKNKITRKTWTPGKFTKHYPYPGVHGFTTGTRAKKTSREIATQLQWGNDLTTADTPRTEPDAWRWISASIEHQEYENSAHYSCARHPGAFDSVPMYCRFRVIVMALQFSSTVRLALPRRLQPNHIK
jgi:hypothetical protein